MAGIMEISQANTIANQSISQRQEEWQKFDYKVHNANESWDQFILRKMREEREYYASRKGMGDN